MGPRPVSHFKKRAHNGTIPLDMLRELHEELGIPVDYGTSGGPPAFDEAGELVDVGPNLVGRMQRLAPAAAKEWQAMVEAAASDGVILLIVSGFRSYEYQAALIRKKINAGQSITDILQVNAAPGHSEHHRAGRRHRDPGVASADRGVRRLRSLPLAGGECFPFRLFHVLSKR